MEELGWERNMLSFPWGNNINHHQQEIEESIIFGSEDTFLDPIEDLSKLDSTPGHQIGSHRHLASSFGSASQYWHQTLTLNGLHEGRNVIPLITNTILESPDCVLPATNSNAYNTTSHDQEDGISVIFSNHKKLLNKVINNFSDVVSSDNFVTKATSDDGADSQSSCDKQPNKSSVLYEDATPRSKRPRSDPGQSTSSTINSQQPTESDETDSDVITKMKNMIYTAAAFRPVSFSDDDMAEKPRRKNVRISRDPQTVAARKRREKISERIRVLQKLVPGGNKMDTASMLDEAANYLKFLRSQVKAFEQFGQKVGYVGCCTTDNAHGTSQNVALGVPFTMQGHFLLPYQQIYPNLPPA